MIKKSRAATIGLLLVLCACSQQDQTSAFNIVTPALQGLAVPSASPVSGSRGFDAIANSPDRGALINYDRRTTPLKQGAYTSHRVQVSEEHAIRAIVTGKLSIPAPGGDYLQLNYERHAENANGNWTWVGRLAGGDKSREAIITFGEKAVFGSIPQSGGRPDLTLTTRAGKLWVVETDPRLAPGIDRRKQDTLVPVAAASRQFGAAASPGTRVTSSSTASATTSSSNTIDVLLGYTTGFAAKFGGQSQAVTRLTHLVDVNNQAYSNSQINGAVRLVGTQQVDYTNGGTNRAALIDLTGSDGSRATTVPASLQPLRAARDALGADLVALVRAYEYVNEGCGIAWLLGAGQQEIVPSQDAPFAYSIVSNLPDGASVPGNDGKNYFCAKETLAHELGHLMGSAHDIESTKDDGVVQYGRYAYSFGAKTDPTAGNFYTVMSYGEDDQTSYRVFSSPNITTCGGLACGTAGQADNARSLNQTIPVVATFRASVFAHANAPNDFNGDGYSDVLWRESNGGRNQVWLSANSSSQQPMTTVPAESWKIVGTGDFNADGRADVVWRDSKLGRNQIWLSGNSSTSLILSTVPVGSWEIVGTGDFDGDGQSDVLWRDFASGRNQVWLSGNSATPRGVTSVPTLSWKVVGIGDFNGDGRSDILWRNSSDGRNQIWLSGNSATPQAVTSVPGLNWSVVGTGDFNGDGRSDIVWRETYEGRNAIWLSGLSTTQQPISSVASRDWKSVQVGDFNADGRSDLVWRNSSNGSNVVWLGGSSSTIKTMSAVASQSWVIVPRRL